MPEEEPALCMYRGVKVSLRNRKWCAATPKAMMPESSAGQREIFRQFAGENSTQVRRKPNVKGVSVETSNISHS